MDFWRENTILYTQAKPVGCLLWRAFTAPAPFNGFNFGYWKWLQWSPEETCQKWKHPAGNNHGAPAPPKGLWQRSEGMSSAALQAEPSPMCAKGNSALPWAAPRTDTALELLAALARTCSSHGSAVVADEKHTPSVILPLKLVQDILRAFYDILVLPAQYSVGAAGAANPEQNQGSKDSPEPLRCFRSSEAHTSQVADMIF